MSVSAGGEAGSGRSENPTQRRPDDILLLYAGTREWFRSALEAVLYPEGFDVVWARDVDEALELVSEQSPDLVIVDERLHDVSAPELCRALRAGVLAEHVPILLYSSDMSSEGVPAEALEAGAWDVIREPIRAESLVASLRRLLRIAGLIGEVRDDRLTDRETGLLTVRGLSQLLPSLDAMARREGIPLSCAVVGPTERGAGSGSRRQRELTARLCRGHVRKADVCGWVKEGDVAILSLGTSSEGAMTLAQRLQQVSEGMAREAEEPGAVLSAIVLPLRPLPTDLAGVADSGNGAEAATADAMSVLARAQEELEATRRAGGGVRVAGEA